MPESLQPFRPSSLPDFHGWRRVGSLFSVCERPVQEKTDGLTLVLKQMNCLLAAASDAAPTARKRCLAEQCRLNRTLDVETIRLGNHCGRIACWQLRVQRESGIGQR